MLASNTRYAPLVYVLGIDPCHVLVPTCRAIKTSRVCAFSVFNAPVSTQFTFVAGISGSICSEHRIMVSFRARRASCCILSWIKEPNSTICATVNGTTVKHPSWAASIALSCTSGYGCHASNARCCSQYGGVLSNIAIRTITLLVVLIRTRSRQRYKCSHGTIFTNRTAV